MDRERYRRESRGLEFDRVSFFTDAVYAIAMTLLVVELQPPELAAVRDPAALWNALWDERSGVIGFFVGFILIGRYWLAHHQFFASLRSVDAGLISLNLVYLAFIAFMPFPVALLSNYEENPVSFFMFAGCMAVVSLLEVAMFLWAARSGHLRFAATPEVMRFAMIAGGAPVLVMLASFPLALYSTTWALLSWLVVFPIGAILDRRTPAALRADAGDVEDGGGGGE